MHNAMVQLVYCTIANYYLSVSVKMHHVTVQLVYKSLADSHLWV